MTLDLFADPTINLLPFDGEAYDIGCIYDAHESAKLFAALLEETPWRHDELFIGGAPMVLARQVAWYGDPRCTYRYSGTAKTPLSWTPLLSRIRDRVQVASGATFNFNSCLLNLYETGNVSLGWHSDDEPELGRRPTIASLSLGATRRFVFRHKASQRKVATELHRGQLIVMRSTTQEHWEHTVPKAANAGSRINLTFRHIVVA